jgi:hypothetical protein
MPKKVGARFAELAKKHDLTISELAGFVKTYGCVCEFGYRPCLSCRARAYSQDLHAMAAEARTDG